MHPAIVLAIFLPIFAAWFCFVSFILSRMSGWAALARRYPCPAAPNCTLHSFQSGRLGSVRYNSSLDVGLSVSGLYLRVFPLFRFGHPPLLIPWSELNGLRQKKILFWTFVEMDVGRPSITTLTIPMHLVDRLLPVAKSK